MKIGIGLIGWSPQRFWASTLPELCVAWWGYQERQRIADARLGVPTSILANANRDPKKRKKPFVAADFFPSLRTDPQTAEERHVQWQQLQEEGDFALDASDDDFVGAESEDE